MKFSHTNLSLRTQLAAVISSLLAAVSVFLVLFFPARMESVSRDWLERRATGMVIVLSDALAPAVEFDDAESVSQRLNGLEKTEDVLYAAVRKVDGKFVASWNTKLVPEDVKPVTDLPVAAFERNELRVDGPVKTKNGERAVVTVGFSLAELEREKSAQLRTVLTVSLLVFMVGLALSIAIGTLLVRPIRSMTDIALKISQGDLSQAELSMSGSDEVGRMAAAFNRMLRSLRELADAADRMGKGDFTGSVELSGMVGDAFNRMREGHRNIVAEIAKTSAQLAGAAAQIYAAAQEQEATASAQSAGIAEVSSTMQSLLESASHIAESARGVLSNAEQTNQTADETSRRLSELSTHTNRIAEILEVIRDIADRSDLLALNASLEATRAGEMGRAFSLVALEMRRLAERVTASVQDVKTLVADVRSSSSSTVMATDEGRKLADGTTSSARQITLLTQQQRTGTEQVSQSMHQISALLTQSVSSAHQTRSAAELLKAQADQLAALVTRFHVDGAEKVMP